MVFAHRGASAVAPENTLAAFDQALDAGADGLELDVHLSRDGVVVVHHDFQLERTTDLHGALKERTADELARADAAYRFGAAAGYPFRGQGLGVPTLSSVLTRYRDVAMIVELKVNTPELARCAIEAIRATDAVERVCLGSSGLRVLRAARSTDPAIATSAAREEVRWALYRSWCRWPLSRVAYRAYQVPESAGLTRIVSPRFIRAAHTAGLPVQVWTVNAETDARRLLGWGADALITDRPDAIAPIVRAKE
jgi:glycerophosphoryl diester phosphodiesterase